MKDLETKLKTASSNSPDNGLDNELVGLYAPHVDRAYKEMQKELEEQLSKYGRVEKTQTQKCFWGERHVWEYKVFNDKGEVIARVTYQQGEENVVVIDNQSSDKLKKDLDDYFVNNYWDNFKKHADRFKKQIYNQPKKPTPSNLELAA